MKKFNWKLSFAVGLLVISVLFLALHLVLFEDAHFLEKYIIFELAMMPVEVIVVTLVLDQLMEARERKERLEKMNMVIGVFFSEVGVELLRKISKRDPSITELRKQLDITSSWTEKDLTAVKNSLKNHTYKMTASPEDLQDIKALVISHRAQLVQLLENPTLLEHEEFTSLMRAVFHLSEELDYRKSLEGLPKSDYVHLSGDAARAYGLLTREWLSYMKYLKVHYPYLFSLSIRTNPFKEEAMPVVRE